MAMNLESLLHNLITSGVKFSDPATILKIKILNISQLIFIILAPLLGLFYFFIGAIPLFYVTTIAGLSMIPGILILRKSKNTVLVGNYAIFIIWTTLFILAWYTGAVTYEGVIRPSLVLNVGLILLAIFLNGYLSGTIWATIVFLETGLIVYLYRAGYQFPNLIPLEISAIYSMGSYFIGLLAILSFAFLFEKEKSDALTREQEKSKALVESKRYIDDILERSPLPTFIIDRSHRVIQWNSACQEMTGVRAEEILGKEVWEGFNIDNQGSIADIILEDPDYLVERYRDSIVSKTETGWFEIEMSLPTLKESPRTIITAAPILDKEGRVRGAIQTIQSVQQPGKWTLENGSYELFPNPIFKIDAQGKINFWNKACEENFGYTSSQMLGNNALGLVAKRYRPVFTKTISKVYQGESFNGMEWRYRSSEGKPVYVLARLYPLQAANGDGKECLIINTDITVLKMKLKRFQLHAAKSKEKLKNLSDEHDLLKKNIATFVQKRDRQT
jgi:PAS domain S-box-containing protein